MGWNYPGKQGRRQKRTNLNPRQPNVEGRFPKKIGQKIRERKDQEGKKDSDSSYSIRRGDWRIQSLEFTKTGSFRMW